MNWLAFLGAVVRLVTALTKFLSDRRLLAAGAARGRAERDAAHARAASEAAAQMQAIADRPPSRAAIDKRLEEGSA